MDFRPNKIWEENGEQRLCLECKEKWEKVYGVKSGEMYWIHCHHESREKPKCWCEIRDRDCREYVVIHGCTVGVEFCPQCGRKL